MATATTGTLPTTVPTPPPGQPAPLSARCSRDRHTTHGQTVETSGTTTHTHIACGRAALSGRGSTTATITRGNHYFSLSFRSRSRHVCVFG